MLYYKINNRRKKGAIAKLWPILKRLIFKQCLIYTRVGFKNDGFKERIIYFTSIKQDFFKWYCLESRISLNNAV